ncbi:hypothetical protein AXF02_00150 [Staphylococcus aureus]|nr:hypothetical protein [Staphylococcus aureus]
MLTFFDIISLFCKATRSFHVFMLFVTSLDYNSDIAHFKLKMEKYSIIKQTMNLRRYNDVH